MIESFSHLVWLGAGQAQQPAGLMQKAEKVTLIEARESAYLKLRQRFTQPNITVKHQLITLTGNEEAFIEYNLPEYSSIQKDEGLKNIFPGLKETGIQTLESVSLDKLIKDLALTDNKNILVVDILDINLKILEGLYKTGDLYKFAAIYIFAANDRLYADSANAQQVDNFLGGIGYFAKDKISVDTDFSWMIFVVNPIWFEWEKTKQSCSDLAGKNKELLKEIEALKQQPMEDKAAIEKLKAEVAQANKTASSRKDSISTLEKEKLNLEITNKQLNQRIKLLEQEMIKVEAQTEIIKELLMVKLKD